MDYVNAIFELIGAYFTWMNAYQLYRDKTIKGVYWKAWIFYTAWGVWNCGYYPALEQTFSFMAGLVMLLGNIVWVALAIHYRTNNEEYI